MFFLAGYILKSLSLRLKREATFRTSFFLRILGKASYVLVYYLFFNILFGDIKDIAGWNRGEVFILVGVSGLVLGLSQSLFGYGAAGIAELVRKGAVELFLTRPLPPYLFMLFREPSITDLLSLPVPLLLIAYGIKLAGTISIFSLFPFAISILISVVIYSLLHMLLGLLAFKFVRVGALFWWLTDFSDYSRYPYRIFPRAFQLVFLYVIPVLAMSNVPVMILTGRPFLIFPFLLLPLPFAILAKSLFAKAIKTYEGTGTYELVGE